MKYKVERENAIEFLKIFKKNNLIEIYNKPYDEEDDFYSYFQSTITYYSSCGLGGLNLLDKLQKMRISILGCGAGGSHTAYYLA